MLGVSPAEVRGFARAALRSSMHVRGARYRFTFRDLVVLRMAAGLRRENIPARRIERALALARGTWGRRGSMARLRLERVGAHVGVRDAGLLWSLDTGQIQLDLEERAPVGEASLGIGAEADAWCERARRLELTSTERTEEAYRRALALDPSHADALVGLGFLLQVAGRLEDAVAKYRRALEVRSDPTAAFNLGLALDDLQQPAEATSAYQRALELDPRMADAHFNLSELLERTGDRAGALRHMIAYRELTTC